MKIEGAMRRQGERCLKFKGKQRDGTVSGRVWKGGHRLGGGAGEGIGGGDRREGREGVPSGETVLTSPPGLTFPSKNTRQFRETAVSV